MMPNNVRLCDVVRYIAVADAGDLKTIRDEIEYRESLLPKNLTAIGEKIRVIFAELATEIWFGVNLRLVLLDASSEELETIQRIIQRAKKARGA